MIKATLVQELHTDRQTISDYLKKMIDGVNLGRPNMPFVLAHFLGLVNLL